MLDWYIYKNNELFTTIRELFANRLTKLKTASFALFYQYKPGTIIAIKIAEVYLQ